MPFLARQGRKISSLANWIRHPGEQQFANCERGTRISRHQSSFQTTILYYSSPQNGHISSSSSFWLANFFYTSKSSLLLPLMPRGVSHFPHVILPMIHYIHKYIIINYFYVNVIAILLQIKLICASESLYNKDS